MKSNRFWVILIACIFAASALAAAAIYFFAGRGTIATVTLDGQVVMTIDLSQGSGYTLPVPGAAYGNVLEVAHGRIRVCRADCPDKTCVGQGWISTAATPIVCLPSRLVVQISGGPATGGIDGVSQ